MTQPSGTRKNLKILLLGGGGREHALAWKIAQSPRCQQLFVAPGNPGTAKLGTNITFLNTLEEVVRFAKEQNIDLVIVGSEVFLAEGIVDELQREGIRTFGPNRLAAQLESSKGFAKEFMERHSIPTARFAFFSNAKDAFKYIESHPFPLVIKADGLASGKGVVIAHSLTEAKHTLIEFMEDRKFGDASSVIVIEEYMRGLEVSIHVFVDGTYTRMFPAAQDHKRIGEGNTGANTGGMGTVAPLSLEESVMTRIKTEIIEPTILGMKNEGMVFRGVLFPGVMITEGGPKVIEFNVRFGDPETQSYMRLLETDLLDILESCIDGSLHEQAIEWKQGATACIVLASAGYPVSYEVGKEINGIEDATALTDIEVFHAGTEQRTNSLVTSGGRVLGVSAFGTDLTDARTQAYNAIEKITFDGKIYRSDIGLYTTNASEDKK